MNYIDAHSHLADPRFDEIRDEILFEAREKGITQHLQGGIGPEDWRRQRELAKQYPGVLLVVGLHPYWVADHSDEECSSALDDLAREIPTAYALGETGLDFRPTILKNDPLGKDRQITCFEAQLEMAKMAGKPIVLHIVRAFAEAKRILEIWGVPEAGGLVHSFNGPWREAKDYLDLGLYISVGGPLARKDNQRLRQTVKDIPMDALLLETDSPDQPGDAIRDKGENQLNRPASLWAVAEVVAELKNISAIEVLDITSQNCRKLLSLDKA